MLVDEGVEVLAGSVGGQGEEETALGLRQNVVGMRAWQTAGNQRRLSDEGPVIAVSSVSCRLQSAQAAQNSAEM